MNHNPSRRETLGFLAAAAAAAAFPRAASGVKAVKFPKGAIIRTIGKDLHPEELGSGITLFHEHLSIDLRPRNAPPPKQPPATDNVEMMIEEVKAAQRDGIVCMVDGGHLDMGRKLDSLKLIAELTGMHIVASGGYYMERTYPPELASMSDDQIADGLVQEVKANRYGAFGEIGENPNAPMSDLEQTVFRAIGKAHLKTNLPIFTHNAYGTGPNVPKDAGLHQLDVFESVGVKPQRIAIGHTCCLDDPEAEVIKQIAKRGAWVAFDRVNFVEQFLSDEKRVKMAVKFLDAGYVNQFLMSSDFTGARTLEGPLYGRSKTVFAPKLMKAGVSEETIHTILYDNPRRFLAFVPLKNT